MRWQECPKNAWLAIHKPDFYYSFEPTEFELALRETGEKVEGIAQGLFPDGVLVEGRDEAAQKLTRKLIDAKTPVIFQPAFSKDGFLAVADVLKFNTETGGYAIYEIKSSSSVKRIPLRCGIPDGAASPLRIEDRSGISYASQS